MNQSGNVTSGIKSTLENWSGGSEADIRRVLVEPVLNALGWDIMDTMEVRAEYKLPKLSGKPDYVLFYGELPVVLVEVKRLNNIDGAKNQLEEYCGSKYVGIATDGNIWRVLIDGKWDNNQITVSNSEDIVQDLSKISKAAVTGGYKNKLVSKKVLGRFDIDMPNDKKAKDWEANIKDTNKALQLLNLFVVKNKDKFRDEESFNLMLRAYVNVIGIVKGEKREVEEILKDETFAGLKNRDKIIKMCKWGKFTGIHRTVRNVDNKSCRDNFLDLMETFSKDGQYRKQGRALERFIEKGYNKEIARKVAILTGILASLQPKEFMVYNRRSYEILKNTMYSHLMDNKNKSRIKNYLYFNKLFRHISDITGKSLVELDIIANKTYESK